MNLNIDFVLLIAVLVLIQLIVLSADVDKDKDKDKDEKSNKVTKSKISHRADALSEEALDNTVIDNKELSLVVHRSNGEEKIYKKSDVA